MGLPLHEVPAFTAKEVKDKLSKQMKKWVDLSKTKKPKEEKKKEPKEDTKKGKKDKGADKPGKTERPMPETLEAAEKLLAEVQAKKTAAVDGEDFDTAQVLKAREKALLAHIETLRVSSDPAAVEKEL